MPSRFRLDDRAGGLLLHPTSLPGPHGCGDLGPPAYRFVDFLAAAGQRWWQMLPVGPVDRRGSPYNSTSAFAGNLLLISLAGLADDGLLEKSDLQPTSELNGGRVDYPAATRFRAARLRRAYLRFAQEGGFHSEDFLSFLHAESGWLVPYALFCAWRVVHRGRPWPTWTHTERARRPRGREARLQSEFRFTLFVQFEFQKQWTALRQYANGRGIGLLGDIPIFVSHDSCDVWANPDLFDLRADGRPRTVSGVPPDYFSRTGQLWGHPHYRWDRHRATRFVWWLARFRRTFALFDAGRIDHFLGFNRVWAVPGGAKTAERGRWVKTPGVELFSTLRRNLGRVEIVAEDLGLVTPEAAALRDRFGFPGMRLLQFAFGNDQGDRYNQPHTYPHNCVVYPGTHDNDTTVGWFAKLKRGEIKARPRAARRRGAAKVLTPYERVLRYLGSPGGEIHWLLIRLALAAPANTAIVPVQDLLGLGNEARMNLPATTRGNWQWRLLAGQLTSQIAHRLRDLTDAYGRVRRER